MKLARYILIFQGIYYLITALWPIVSIDSFMMVSGPKTDIWLVKTVAVLLLVIASTLLFGVILNINYGPVLVLAISTCIGLSIIDIYYAGKDIISDIYLLDAGIELLLFIAYMVALFLLIRKADTAETTIPDRMVSQE